MEVKVLYSPDKGKSWPNGKGVLGDWIAMTGAQWGIGVVAVTILLSKSNGLRLRDRRPARADFCLHRFYAGCRTLLPCPAMRILILGAGQVGAKFL